MLPNSVAKRQEAGKGPVNDGRRLAELVLPRLKDSLARGSLGQTPYPLTRGRDRKLAAWFDFAVVLIGTRIEPQRSHPRKPLR